MPAAKISSIALIVKEHTVNTTSTANMTGIHTTPTIAPASNSKFRPSGSPLLDEASCAVRVKSSSWEPRSDNTPANKHVPTSQQIADLAPWGPSTSLDTKADTLRQQITGNFTGTTDTIFQWAACKWGIDPDIIRAEAVLASSWHQSQLSDWTTDSSLCPPGTWNGKGCFQSYGILQT